MKQSILLLLVVSLNQITFGQGAKLEGVFAFVYNPLAELPNTNIAETNTSVQMVFDNLIEAKGVKSILPPKLVVSNTESVAAWAQPANQIIGIEKKALDICRTMGSDSLNAMAGLLAHELIHYYENHDWHNHFVHNYSELAAQSENESGKKMEMEADDMGGLLAHMAGYNALNVMPTLLRKVYKEYNLDVNDNLSYPNLENRVKMAELSRQNLSSLIPLYEFANYLMVINEIDLAAQYLEFIVSKSGFVSREIQNNLGVLYAIAAYNQRPNQNLQYNFPFQIDLDTRLGTKGIDNKSFDVLSDKAIQYFEAAQSLDKSYEPAYVNLACMYILKNDNFEAEYQLRKLSKEVAEINTDLNCVHGLMAIYEGENEKAKALWEKSAEDNNILAKSNLRILNKKEQSQIIYDQPMSMTVDKVDLNKLYAMISQEKVTPNMSVDLDENQSFYIVELESSEIYIHLDYEKDEQYYFFHIIDQPNNQLPLNIGESVDILVDYYGEPDINLSTSSGGAIYNYKQLNMIAIIKEDKISKWCIYKQKN